MRACCRPRWCRRWAGRDSLGFHQFRCCYLTGCRWQIFTGDWQRIMRSRVSAEDPPPSSSLSLPNPALASYIWKLPNTTICTTLRLCWRVFVRFLPTSDSHIANYPRFDAWERGKKEPLKRQDNEGEKFVCLGLSMLWRAMPRRCGSQMRARDSSHGQRDVYSLAWAEWQRAKWAWPWRRGNSITVCRSAGRARERLQLHFKSS